MENLLLNTSAQVAQTLHLLSPLTNSQDLPQAFPFPCCQAKSLLSFPVNWGHCPEVSSAAHAHKRWGLEVLPQASVHIDVFVHPRTDAGVASDAHSRAQIVSGPDSRAYSP